jgi:hypothetical protein
VYAFLCTFFWCIRVIYPSHLSDLYLVPLKVLPRLLVLVPIIVNTVVFCSVQTAHIQWLETRWPVGFFAVLVFGVQNDWWRSYNNGAGDNRPILFLIFCSEVSVALPNTMPTNSFLGALALQFRKATISLVTSVRFTSWDSATPTEILFVKFRT